MFGELEIQEWQHHSDVRMRKGDDTLVLSNDAGKEIDETEIAKQLGKIIGIENVKSLVIQPNSRMKNLKFIQVMPKLESLVLYGHHLVSLDGLEYLTKGKFIKIDTGAHRKRDIEKIGGSTISRLSLTWGNQNDLIALGRNSTIQNLELRKCPDTPVQHLRNVPIESMSLVNAGIEQFGESVLLRVLKSLTVFDCRKLKAFTGNNSNVSRVMIQACNNLDLRTISTMANIEFMNVINIKKEIRLSIFVGLKQLRSLSIQNCKFRIDVKDLKSASPKLEEIWISGVKKDQVDELSMANGDVVVSSASGSYRNGEPVADQ